MNLIKYQRNHINVTDHNEVIVEETNPLCLCKISPDYNPNTHKEEKVYLDTPINIIDDYYTTRTKYSSTNMLIRHNFEDSGLIEISK